MSIRGWFPDPSGRFAQRWYDGHQWTDRVVAANGTTIEDPLPDSDKPHPPPVLTQVVPPAAAPAPPAGAAAPPAPPAPAAPRPGPPASPPFAPGAAAKVRLSVGATLFIGLFGWLLVALSLLGVPWYSDGPGFNFFDLTDGAWNSSGGDFLVRAYAAALGYLFLVGALLGVVLAGLPVPGRPGAATAWRIIASLGSGVAVVLHTVTVVKVFRGPADPGVGAWLGVIGYFVVIVAMVIGHYRRRVV